MQLYIRRKIFSLKRKYTIIEIAKGVSYYAEGNFFSKETSCIYTMLHLKKLF